MEKAVRDEEKESQRVKVRLNVQHFRCPYHRHQSRQIRRCDRRGRRGRRDRRGRRGRHRCLRVLSFLDFLFLPLIFVLEKGMR